MILRWLVLFVVFPAEEIVSSKADISEDCFRNENNDITPILQEDEHCDSLISCRNNNSKQFGVCEPYFEKNNSKKFDFLLITVASNATDGFKRFQRSADIYNVPTKVLGMGQKWEGGNMKGPGGGYKVNLLKKALEEYANDNSKIIMFTDSYDVIITGSVPEIIERFDKLDARIVFSAELFCWPNDSLADKYPVTESRYKYLNSGGFMGYASDLYELLSTHEISNTGDDQLFYTQIFLDQSTRDRYRIILDTRATIFQNLLSAEDDVEIDYEKGIIKNTLYNTNPLVLHGNGPAKLSLLNFGNYLAKSWDPVKGCLVCEEDNIQLEKINEANYPEVLIGVFVTQPSPFIAEFFEKLLLLDYPKNKLRFFVYNSVEYHIPHVKYFTRNISSKSEYKSVKEIKPEDDIKEAYARNTALDYCLTKNCDYFFSIDSLSHLDNTQTLKTLIKLNKTIIAPMLVRPYKAWSNFWGSLNKDGYYNRAFDYMEIVNNDRRGIWNVPYISSAYLLNSSVLKENKPSYELELLDAEMSFSQNYRNKGIFMYVTNLFDFGHLVDPEAYDITRTHPDMYEIFTNRYDWEQKYIHSDYAENFNPDKVPQQPCQDVYWFPVVSPAFCKQLIEIVEAFGQWSDGSNKDNRLVGGYENVPTRDIHMNQVGYENIWMEFLRLFVRPLQEHVFTGYFHDDDRLGGGYEAVPTRDIHLFQVELDQLWDYFLKNIISPLQQSVFIGYLDPPRSLMNFVVRYKPDEQPSLRPHHDSSTYTINLALNTPKVDYEGGGCKFIRYNCSVTDTRLGWVLMHPGRLTHYHEGLKVEKGTRYIMISFVDP